ncbi:MAG: non-canonical purine NTP pyrophosphatase [Planctomycetota bacterium]
MKNIFIVIGTKNSHKIKEILAIWREFNRHAPPVPGSPPDLSRRAGRSEKTRLPPAGGQGFVESGYLRDSLRGKNTPIIRFLPLSSFPDIPAVKEDGRTYSENAAKKALIWAKNTGYPTLAEDSGIEVKALKWQPGRYSARYASLPDSKTDRNKIRNALYKNNNQKLLDKLHKLSMSKRTARYRCSAVLASPQGKIIAKSEGICRGKIAFKPTGKNGFGYDPIFMPCRKTADCNQLTFGQLPTKLKHSIGHRGKALRKIFKKLPQIIDTLQKKPYIIKATIE